MRTEKRKGRGMFVFICIAAFIGSLGIGAVSKVAIKPSWAKKYSVQMTDEIGTVYKDLSYGEGEANKFDLYVPRMLAKKTTVLWFISMRVDLHLVISRAMPKCLHGSVPKAMLRRESTTRFVPMTMTKAYILSLWRSKRLCRR